MPARNLDRQWMLKPHDLVVAFKLSRLTQRPSYQELAKQLSLSQFEAHAAVQRLVAAGLYSDLTGLNRHVFADCLCFGAVFIYPAVRTEVTIGTPTAHGAEPLRSKILFADSLPPVWPNARGSTRGTGLIALYPKAPLAALADPALYERMALFDALRIGQARERELAGRLLRERLLGEIGYAR
jgi:hypothetical protein